MATARDIRRLAFQILYQLDARGGQAGAGASPEDAQLVLAGLIDDPEEAVKFTPGEIKKAFTFANSAFGGRSAADAFTEEAAPGWPAHRQAAVDRAILRLAHFEMTRTGVDGGEPTHPKIVVNEAVELAKMFSTEKSPSFINGLLDKLLKQVLLARGESLEPAEEVPPAP